MKNTMIAAVVLFSVVCGALAHAQYAPNPNVSLDRLRFRMVGDEPIASPDGHGIVNGWKAIVVRDLKTDQCYIAFAAGAALAVTGPGLCP